MNEMIFGMDLSLNIHPFTVVLCAASKKVSKFVAVNENSCVFIGLAIEHFNELNNGDFHYCDYIYIYV